MNTQTQFNQPLIHSPRPTDCRATNWRAQFACPTGKFGWLIGYVMAFKNAKMNRFAVETLDVQSEDQVLELGFGHGRTIRQIAARTDRGFVAGVDLSHVMVQQATQHNHDLIRAGRVELSRSSVANIPYEYARFDKVLAVNNYQFWPNAELNLNEIRRVLRPNGLLTLCLRLKNPNKMFQLAPGFTWEEIEEIVGLVRWVGFREVQVMTQRAGNEAACVTARR